MAQKQEQKSYLTEAISSLSPWSSRSTSPKSNQDPQKDKDSGKSAADVDGSSATTLSANAGASDHSVSHWHSLSAKKYPKDCPKLNVQWFHAVDAALRKPKYINTSPAGEEKAPAAPKKWMAFSPRDSASIEKAFQKLSEEEQELDKNDSTSSMPSDNASQNLSDRPHLRSNRSIDHLPSRTESSPKVPVNEDYLFDVDIKNRELGPAYWLGPVYSVRRGTWFFIEGTTMRPCDENLAFQLEEGYLKMRPWKLTQPITPSTSSSTPSQGNTGPSPDTQNPDPSATESSKASTTSQTQPALLTHRLFGSYMNSIVTYENETTAWLLSDDFLSRMSSSVYQRFAGGAHLSGTKVVRGYQDLSKKAANAKEDKNAPNPSKSTNQTSKKSDQVRPGNPLAETNLQKAEQKNSANETEVEASEEPPPRESQRKFLERQISNLMISSYYPNREMQAEEARQREEKEIRDDYRDLPGDDQDRPVDHLILVTHGIGQRLGARFETFNFIHDVNELRKTVKKVYSDSPDLQALNGEVENSTKNCRIQVLPICWRHLLEFPLHSLKEKKEEQDLSETGQNQDQTYPSLDDITVEGVPVLRGILVDLVLDILLYQTPVYKNHISKVVTEECNRILNLFRQRNPAFNGKVSLLGHSLGSAVLFDLLCMQPEDPSSIERFSKAPSPINKDMKFDFDVENMVCFGSPLGLFQMLNGKTISGRSMHTQVTLDGSKEGIQDPFDMSFAKEIAQKGQDEQQQIDSLTSSPKCKQLYNIFHPTDPVGYRLEPLISQSMSSLQPQNLPYTKGSFLGAPIGHGLTGIPAKVGQSFSDLWSSFSSGLTNNFINRSLGITAEDAAKISDSQNSPTLLQRARSQSLSQVPTQSQSEGAGTNITAGGVIPGQWQSPVATPAPVDEARRRKLALETAEAEKSGANLPTLIDSELETLFAGFQSSQAGNHSGKSDSKAEGDGKSWREADVRGRRLKREEAKVRALNTNGRVDYKIQEGAFDISFLQSIASHLAYWTDEDVCHFLVSQMLAQQQRAVGNSKSK